MERLFQSPTDPTFIQNPYRFYQRARALGDFVFWEDFDLPVATTHEAVNAVMKHRSLGRAMPAELKKTVPEALKPFYDIDDHSMLELEPPDHTRLRGLVLRAFTKGHLLHLGPQISQISDALIDEFPADPFDFLEAFAQKLPVIIIARFLGIPEEMGPELLAWSNAMVAMYQARRTPQIEAAAATAASEFSDYLSDYIDRRRAEPAGDLISELIAVETEGARLSGKELISTCILLLNAGHEATVHSLGKAVWHLADFPERALTIDPENIAATVEECLRFDPPLHMFTRYVYDPVTLLDQPFQRGDVVGCLLGSACRDDAVWPDGDVFDPFRMTRAHTAFGAGIHFCVGAPLARLELQIALPILFARCPNLRVAEPPRIANLYHFHGLEALQVQV